MIALIDYDWRVIPNLITFAGIPLGIIAAWRLMPEAPDQSLIGALGGAGFLFLTGEVYLLVRRTEGVGLGDVFLIGMIGAFLGWPGVIFTLFGGSLLGAAGGIVFALAGGAPAPPEERVPAAIAEITACGAAICRHPKRPAARRRCYARRYLSDHFSRSPRRFTRLFSRN